MKETLMKRAAELLKVKSLTTLILTAVFAVLAMQERITQDFLTIYTVVIAFYFGTQSRKAGEETA
ncbi:MAG: hypothetical protein IJX52_01595 [Oscillibacter sp.]|nr:hypothetical protein [Oscillibacter sp.]